jgi:hypothetical protein
MGLSMPAAPSAKESPIISLVIGAICAIGIVLGLVAGIVALFGIRRHGTKGILVPALIGIGLNGTFLALSGLVVVLLLRGDFPLAADLDRRKQLVGEWEMTGPEKGTVTTLVLRDDGTFRFRILGDRVADFSGSWKVQRNRLVLAVDKIEDGNRDNIGAELRWSIDRIEADKVIFQAADGTLSYKRKKGSAAP